MQTVHRPTTILVARKHVDWTGVKGSWVMDFAQKDILLVFLIVNAPFSIVRHPSVAAQPGGGDAFESKMWEMIFLIYSHRNL